MPEGPQLAFADLEPVGPGTPTGRYLRLFWHPVARVADLAKGRAKPIEFLGEKFTLYRGESGEAHVVAFRCAHRGTQLSLGWVEGDDLRCRYHGWRFDASGQCVEQPNEDRPFCARVKLRAYPTQEYLGLVFAFLGDGAPPSFPRYPDLDRPGVIVTDPVEFMPCSFWNRLDNDHSHIAWVHRATAQRVNRPDFLKLRREEVEETAYGWRSTRYVKGESEPIRAPNGSAHFFMPNVYQFWARTRAKGFETRNLWDTKITWTVPVNDAKFAAFDATHTPLDGAEAKIYAASRAEQQEPEVALREHYGEAILAGDLTAENLPSTLGAYTSFIIEDYTTQVGQGPVTARGRERLAGTDGKLVLLRRMWVKEVTALLAGAPLTAWQLPTTPLQTVTAE